jgi:hypothetical protein
MILAILLLLTLTSSELLAQSRPISAECYNPNNTLQSRYTFAYDSLGNPLSVIHSNPENSRITIYIDFVRMPGWHQTLHPLFPEFYAQSQVNLEANELLTLDTIGVISTKMGPYGFVSSMEKYWNDATHVTAEYAEFSYSKSGYLETSKSWTERYVGGELIETRDMAFDTAIVERIDGRLISHYWPPHKVKQVYNYRNDGSVYGVEKLNLNFAEPRLELKLVDIQSVEFDHPLEQATWAGEKIQALANHYVTSASVRKWSDDLWGLDTAIPYVAAFDPDGRKVYSKFLDGISTSQFEEGAIKDYVFAFKGDTIEYLRRQRQIDGGRVLSQFDTIFGIDGYSGNRYKTSHRYLFNYEQASVKLPTDLNTGISANWDRRTRIITLTSESVIERVNIYSIAGICIGSSYNNGFSFQMHLPNVPEGVYLVQAVTPNGSQRLKLLMP